MLEVTGMNELLQRIEQMGRTIDSELKSRALDDGSEVLRAKIAAETKRSNRNSKHAADNVIVEQGSNPDVRDIGYHKDHWYMRFREMGTKNQSADPAMGRAYENNKEAAQSKMADVIKRELGL